MCSDTPQRGKRQAEPDRQIAAARAPSQLRGQARVGAILDAAAELVAEQGLAGVTMHAVAQRAKTSTGSMYHFFPDREAVLQALMDRHMQAMDVITSELHAIPADDWKALSPSGAICRLMTPYTEYLQRHADFLPLKRGRGTAKGEADFIRMIRHMLDARLPSVATARREEYAMVMQAIAAGTMQVGYQSDPSRADLYLREIPCVLAAYLTGIERRAQV
jgi:AcrR family transcriptional regulator